MEIRSQEDLKKKLLQGGFPKTEFPAEVSFPLNSLYNEIVTQIGTTGISDYCILFDSAQAVEENEEFSDEDYWEEDISEETRKSYWFFAQTGTGDSWIFDKEGKVFYFDHNLAIFDPEVFVDLGLDFPKWLQYAHINKEFYDETEEVDDDTYFKIREVYKTKLSELSELLLENYPFEI